ncbi:MAG: pyridoxamine 5'-phosphate oxidase family protein [Kibdelosporangium sp.]
MEELPAVEVLSEYECFRLLPKVPVGRIVFVDRALPAIQPVNFAAHGQTVVIRTGTYSRLAIAATGTVVAFEIDEFGQDGVRTGWSVVAVGRASQVTDPAELVEVRQLGLRPWAGGTKEFYVRVDIELISGRRLRTRE